MGFEDIGYTAVPIISSLSLFPSPSFLPSVALDCLSAMLWWFPGMMYHPQQTGFTWGPTPHLYLLWFITIQHILDKSLKTQLAGLLCRTQHTVCNMPPCEDPFILLSIRRSSPFYRGIIAVQWHRKIQSVCRITVGAGTVNTDPIFRRHVAVPRKRNNPHMKCFLKIHLIPPLGMSNVVILVASAETDLPPIGSILLRRHQTIISTRVC